MKTNAFPGFDNIKQLYDWNCYTKQDLVDYVNMNCLTKRRIYKNLENRLAKAKRFFL